MNLFSFFQQAKLAEQFGGQCSKVKAILYSPIQPSPSNLLWQPGILVDLIENPKSVYFQVYVNLIYIYEGFSVSNSVNVRMCEVMGLVFTLQKY